MALGVIHQIEVLKFFLDLFGCLVSLCPCHLVGLGSVVPGELFSAHLCQFDILEQLIFVCTRTDRGLALGMLLVGQVLELLELRGYERIIDV